MTTNPLWLFAFLLPFALWAWLFVLRGVRPRTRVTACSLSALLALSAVLLSVNLFGRALRSFDRALVASWVLALIALAGTLLLFRRAERPPGFHPLPSRTANALLLVLAPLVVAVALLALFTTFHDEIVVTGHMSIANSIARGTYPPVYIPFPDVPYRYHYGFDVLAALLVRLAPIPAEYAIDILTILLFTVLFLLVWGTTFELARSTPGAWVAAALVTLGGGFAFIFFPSSVFVGSPLGAFTQEGANLLGAAVNPNMLSYFFQHPFALGAPLFVCCIYLYIRYLRESRLLPAALLAVLFGLLALAQICLFVILACAFLVFPVIAAPLRIAKARRLFLSVVLVLLPGLALALLNGGFFVQTDALDQPLHLRSSLGFAPGGFFTNLLWMLASQGWMLLLLPVAAFLAIRRRRDFSLFCCVLAFGALLPAHIFKYDRTWDVIKFFTVSYLAAALAVSEIFSPRRDRALPRGLQRLAVVVVLTGALPGAVFLASGLYRSSRPDPSLASSQDHLALSATDFEALDWLRSRAAPGDVLFTDTEPPFARSATAYTGLFNPVPDNAYALGFPEETVRRREEDLFIALHEMCFRRLVDLSVDWLYLTPTNLYDRSALSRNSLATYREQGWLSMREFGPPEDCRFVCRLEPPSDDVPCLCNFHIDDYLRELGARALGQDLLTAPVRELWRSSGGASLPESRFVAGDDRAEALRVTRPSEGPAVPAVARIPVETLLNSGACEISFYGRSPDGLMGQVGVSLVDGDGRRRPLRTFRWTAREWETYSFFVKLPSQAQGELALGLGLLERGVPGEVFYHSVALRRASPPAGEPSPGAFRSAVDTGKLIGGD